MALTAKEVESNSTIDIESSESRTKKINIQFSDLYCTPKVKAKKNGKPQRIQ